MTKKVEKRYELDVVRVNNKLTFAVKDRVENIVQEADATKSAQMLLGKLEAKFSKRGVVIGRNNNQPKVDKVAEARKRAEQIKAGSGKKCACCGSELSVRAAEFMLKHGPKVPTNHRFYKKWLCPNCQKKTGVSQFLLTK